MRSWLTWLVGSVIHNLTPAFGEKFLWRHHGMSFTGKESNKLPERVFQIKSNQTADQGHENASRTSPGLFGGVFVKFVGNRIPASDLWKRAGSTNVAPTPRSLHHEFRGSEVAPHHHLDRTSALGAQLP